MTDEGHTMACHSNLTIIECTSIGFHSNSGSRLTWKTRLSGSMLLLRHITQPSPGYTSPNLCPEALMDATFFRAKSPAASNTGELAFQVRIEEIWRFELSQRLNAYIPGCQRWPCNTNSECHYDTHTSGQGGERVQMCNPTLQHRCWYQQSQHLSVGNSKQLTFEVGVEEGCHKAPTGCIHMDVDLPALGLVELLHCCIQLLYIVEVAGVGCAKNGHDTCGAQANTGTYTLAESLQRMLMTTCMPVALEKMSLA